MGYIAQFRGNELSSGNESQTIVLQFREFTRARSRSMSYNLSLKDLYIQLTKYNGFIYR